MSDKMREEFEKWALKHTTLCLDRHKTGNYMKYASNVAWAAWQAARTVPDELRKDAEKWRDLCSRVGADPAGTISYAGPLEGAPEDWAAIAQGKGE